MAKKNEKGLLNIFINGLLGENPVFRLALGMCPTLAITTMASNGISMGIATTLVLVFSNLAISLVRKIIPENVRIPSFIIIIASFVTILEMLIKAFVPILDQTLGIYIPLIVVNCIIFARAESFAFHNSPIPSIVDGLGMGIGFMLAITLLASIREIFGMGTIFGIDVFPANIEPFAILSQPAGGFLALGFLLAAVNGVITIYSRNNKKDISVREGGIA